MLFAILIFFLMLLSKHYIMAAVAFGVIVYLRSKQV